MFSKPQRSFLMYFMTLLFVFFPIPAGVSSDLERHSADGDVSAPNILVLHAYHTGITWTDNITKGIITVFNTEIPHANLFFEYMDAGRIHQEDYPEHLQDFLSSKYKKMKMDMVITSGDPALVFLLTTGKDLFPDIPLVFCAVNKYDPVLHRRTNGPLTGVIEYRDITATMDTALKLHPDTQEIIYIADDHQPDAIPRETEERIFQRYKNINAAIHFKHQTMAELQNAAPGLSKETLVMAYVFSRDIYNENPKRYAELKKLAERCPAPIYSVWHDYLGYGIVGGMLTSGEMHGKKAAGIAVGILLGKKPSNVPVTQTGSNQYMFDQVQMARFGIRDEDLPEGSIITNRHHTLHENLTYQVWGLGMFTVILVLLGIFFNRGKMATKRTITILKESKKRLSLLLDDLPAPVFIQDEKHKYIFVNKKMHHVFGEKVWIGSTPLDIFPEPEAARIMEENTKTLSKGHLKYLDTIVDENDEEHIYEIHKFRIDRQDIPTLIGGFAIDMTPHIQTEGNLRESEERYRNLFENIQDGLIVLDVRTMLFEDANTAALDLYGYKRSEFLKIGPEQITTAPEQIADKINKFLDGAMNKNPHPRYHIKKDGTIFPVGVTIGQINIKGRKKLISVIRDMSNQKSIENELKKERNRAQMYLDVAGVILIALDVAGNVILLNKKGCEILEYKEHEIIGKSWFDTCLPVSVRDDLKNGFLQMMHGSLETMEYVENPVLTKNYEERQIAWHNALLKDDDGNIIGTISSGEDITDRKKAEAEKERLTNQLRHTQKIEAIGTLAGGIAHDFNNILSPLLGYAELLRADIPQDSPIQKYINGILNATNRSRDLVRQILAFSRQSQQEVVPMKVQPVIREALKLLRSSLPTTIDIQQNIDNACGVVNVDPTKIHQIMMNLATNAYHAMEETGGTLDISLKQVHLDSNAASFTALPPGEYARLVVSDTGMGIEQNVLAKVFDPYFTTKDTGKGTGLGLSIVEGIVKGSNGDIRIFSAPGQGTEIHVYLPILEREMDHPNAGHTEPIQGGTEKILLVDDEEAIINIEKQILERLGYHVTISRKSTDALERFKTRPEDFDLVISDMTMPKMTGIRLTREIKKIRPEIPVILCTGYSTQIDKDKSKVIGIQELLTKPVGIREMAEAIRKALTP